MNEIYSTIAFELASGERLGIHVRRGAALHVSGERLWVTRSNDEADYFLHDGDTLPLRPNETLWLSVDGSGPARLKVTLKGGTRGMLANWFGERLAYVHATAFRGSKLGMRIG